MGTTTPTTRTPLRVWIWADTVGGSTCRDDRCGARITWAENASTGKRIPFDGELVAIRTDTRDGRPVWEVDLDENHWKSCPGASDFRRRDARPAAR